MLKVKLNKFKMKSEKKYWIFVLYRMKDRFLKKNRQQNCTLSCRRLNYNVFWYWWYHCFIKSDKFVRAFTFYTHKIAIAAIQFHCNGCSNQTFLFFLFSVAFTNKRETTTIATVMKERDKKSDHGIAHTFYYF